MLRDAEHFKSKIGGIDGAGDTGDFLIRLVKDKSVPAAAPTTSTPPPSDTGSTNGAKTSAEIIDGTRA